MEKDIFAISLISSDLFTYVSSARDARWQKLNTAPLYMLLTNYSCTMHGKKSKAVGMESSKREMLEGSLLDLWI